MEKWNEQALLSALNIFLIFFLLSLFSPPSLPLSRGGIKPTSLNQPHFKLNHLVCAIVHQTTNITPKYKYTAACLPPQGPAQGQKEGRKEWGEREWGDVYFTVSHYSAISSVLSREMLCLKKISSLQLSYKLN